MTVNWGGSTHAAAKCRQNQDSTSSNLLIELLTEAQRLHFKKKKKTNIHLQDVYIEFVLICHNFISAPKKFFFIVSEQGLRKWAKKRQGSLEGTKIPVMKIWINNMPTAVISSKYFISLLFSDPFLKGVVMIFILLENLLPSVLFWLRTLLNHILCSTTAVALLAYRTHGASLASVGPYLGSSSGRRLFCVFPLFSDSLMKLISSRKEQFSAVECPYTTRIN